jgi:hypothetical protein|eukprot:SAG25_NODE_217_length_11656_cov_91.443108_3_plen_76_part_00
MTRPAPLCTPAAGSSYRTKLELVSPEPWTGARRRKQAASGGQRAGKHPAWWGTQCGSQAETCAPHGPPAARGARG